MLVVLLASEPHFGPLILFIDIVRVAWEVHVE